jgi:hypothetical protein
VDSTGTWSGGLNWLAQAVDIMNWHMYVISEEPEVDLPAGSTNNWIQRIKGILAPADLLKPLWNGEGSCAGPGSIWNDNYSRAGFVLRYMALLWSSKVTESMWYMYNANCRLFNSLSDRLTPAGTAWNSSYNWLVGSTPVHNPFCSNTGTIWTCPLVEATGKPAELVWDSQYGPGGTTAPTNCSTASVPTICGSTTYTVPALYSADWIDMDGTSHPYSSTVTIGAVPILLEGS